MSEPRFPFVDDHDVARLLSEPHGHMQVEGDQKTEVEELGGGLWGTDKRNLGQFTEDPVKTRAVKPTW